MASTTTITKLSKNKILKARAGIKALPAVTQMAFGNGADGTPSENDNTLKNELLRKDLSSIEQVTDTGISVPYPGRSWPTRPSMRWRCVMRRVTW